MISFFEIVGAICCLIAIVILASYLVASLCLWKDKIFNYRSAKLLRLELYAAEEKIKRLEREIEELRNK